MSQTKRQSRYPWWMQARDADPTTPTDTPIKDERFEVMEREAQAFIAAQMDWSANARHWSDREHWFVITCAPLIAKFALNILDLKTQRVAADHQRLLDEVERLRVALWPYAVGVDPMSYHGELMVCSLCKATWNNGRKRGEPATPERHEQECLLQGESTP